MNIFKYHNSNEVDLNAITKKASNLIINKRSLTNRYSIFNTFSEYFDSVVEMENVDRMKYNTAFRYVRSDYSDNYTNPSNLSRSMPFETRSRFKNQFSISHGTSKYNSAGDGKVISNGKYEYTAVMVNNVYLGVFQGRIYTLLQHVYDRDDESKGFVAVETYPIELLYASFSKDYYNDITYNGFNELFEDRTVTIIPRQGTAFTYYPKKLDCISSVSPVGYSKVIGSANRAMVVNSIHNRPIVTGTFNSEKHSPYMCGVIHTLSSFLPEEFIMKLVPQLPESDTECYGYEFMQNTLHDIVMKYAPQYMDDVKAAIMGVFDADITQEYTLKHLVAIMGVSQLSNGVNDALFFQVDNVIGYVTDEYLKMHLEYGKLPLKALLSIEGFGQQRLVRMSYDGESDSCTFTYTDAGKRITEEFMETYKSHGISKKWLDDKLLSMHYYMSEPFLMDVAHSVYFNKDNLKNFLKGCVYVQN